MLVFFYFFLIFNQGDTGLTEEVLVFSLISWKSL